MNEPVSDVGALPCVSAAAANSTLSSLVLLEMVGLSRLTNAFGLTLLFRGVAAVLGTPLAGG